MSELRDAALGYAAKGWRVFPVRPRGKTPLTTHGLKDATTDEETIREWWQKHPTANIGFATGGGIVVLDIDELGQWTDVLDDHNVPAPDTSRFATSRGWQLLFLCDEPIRNSAGKLRPGLDVRGDGGYSILPPSVHPSGDVYTWERNGTPAKLPEWLRDLLTKPQLLAPVSLPDRTPLGESPYGNAALEAEAALVAGAIEGTRNDRLNTAALKLGQLVAGGELDEHEVRAALLAAALSSGLSEREATATINSGLSAGLKQPRRASEQLRKHTRSAADAPVRTATADPERLSLRNLNTYRIRQVEWLDKPILQRSAFHLLAGRKGSLKGTWLCGLAARVTRGDLYSEPKRVLVVTSEDSVELDFLPRLVAAGGDPNLAAIVNGPFRMPADINWLREQALDLSDVGLIVIDPIGNHLGGADTDREGLVREAIAPLNDLADELDCMIFGVRHLGKDSSRGALASVLGSTAWVDVPRSVILMAADDEDDRLYHAQVVAGNRGPRGSGRAYRLELVNVPPATEITLAVPEGESTKDVTDLLGPASATSSRSASGHARELILDILDNDGEQESDSLDARVAQETGITAKTVQNLRNKLRADGLIQPLPDKDEHGTVIRWRVRRTNAPRTDS